MKPQILSKHCKNCKYAKLLLAVQNHNGTKFTFNTLDEFIYCEKLKYPYRIDNIACTKFKSIFDHTI